MKKTLDVNIGGRPFIIDEDAYHTLNDYLNAIDIRLDGAEHTEVLEDIESRIADLFQERLSTRQQVVSRAMVEEVIVILGPAQEFGEPCRPHSAPFSTDSATGEEAENGNLSSTRSKRFYRSRTDRMIGGVCGGVARYFDIDPLIVRIATIIITALTGVTLLLYIVLWIIVPLTPCAPDAEQTENLKQ